MTGRFSILSLLTFASVAFGTVLQGGCIGDGTTVSAQEIAERAELAQSQLLDGLGPDATLHVVEIGYQSQSTPPGPFVLPQRWRSEWWAYFGSDGRLQSLNTEVRDQATGEIVQVAVWDAGTFTYTDVASGETRSHPLEASAETLRETISTAQVASVDLSSPKSNARTEQIDGLEAYVIDRSLANGVVRSYVEKTDYREVKWERLEGQVVVESRETPVFEIVSGKVDPS